MNIYVKFQELVRYLEISNENFVQKMKKIAPLVVGAASSQTRQLLKSMHPQNSEDGNPCRMKTLWKFVKLLDIYFWIVKETHYCFINLKFPDPSGGGPYVGGDGGGGGWGGGSIPRGLRVVYLCPPFFHPYGLVDLLGPWPNIEYKSIFRNCASYHYSYFGTGTGFRGVPLWQPQLGPKSYKKQSRKSAYHSNFYISFDWKITGWKNINWS